MNWELDSAANINFTAKCFGCKKDIPPYIFHLTMNFEGGKPLQFCSMECCKAFSKTSGFIAMIL